MRRPQSGEKWACIQLFLHIIQIDMGQMNHLASAFVEKKQVLKHKWNTCVHIGTDDVF